MLLVIEIIVAVFEVIGIYVLASLLRDFVKIKHDLIGIRDELKAILRDERVKSSPRLTPATFTIKSR